IITDMLGRRLDHLYPERRPSMIERPALRVRDLAVGQKLSGVGFDLLEGEVLGVAALQGHGQRELFQALFGVSRHRGSVDVWGNPTRLDSPRCALTGEGGLALVPEDRRSHGLLLSKSVRENLTLSVLSRFTRLGFTKSAKEKILVDEMIGFLKI